MLRNRQRGSSRPMAMVDRIGMRALRLLSAALCLTLAGCLEMEQTITLQADGSGTQAVRMVMPESTFANLKRASQAAKLGGGADPAAVFDKETVARDLGAAGLELVDHVAKRVPGKRSVELTASFGSFAGLQASPLCGSAAEWVLAAGPREGTAKLTLYPQGRQAWLDARAKAEKMPTERDPVTEAFFAKRQEELAGLDLTIRFDLPGDVLVWTRNLDKTGDRQVTARVTAEQIKTPEDLVRRLAPRFEVIFDASGCKLPLVSGQ